MSDDLPHVRTRTFQVMPNHMHGIVEIIHRPPIRKSCRGGVSPPRMAISRSVGRGNPAPTQ